MLAQLVVLAAVVGAATAVAELIARYARDGIGYLVALRAVWYYIGATSAIVVAVAIALHLASVVPAGPGRLPRVVVEALLAGTLTSAVIGTLSRRKTRRSRRDSSVALLASLDVAVDRARAARHADFIGEIVRELSFRDLTNSVAPLVLAIVRSTPAAVVEDFQHQIEALEQSEMPERAKVFAGALALLDVSNEQVMETALRVLSNAIPDDGTTQAREQRS